MSAITGRDRRRTRVCVCVCLFKCADFAAEEGFWDEERWIVRQTERRRASSESSDGGKRERMLPDTWGAKTGTGGGHQWTGRGKASNTGLVTDDVQVPCFYSALLFWHASPYCPITAERQNWFRLTSERQIHVIHPETNRESDPFSTGLWYSQR